MAEPPLYKLAASEAHRRNKAVRRGSRSSAAAPGGSWCGHGPGTSLIIDGSLMVDDGCLCLMPVISDGYMRHEQQLRYHRIFFHFRDGIVDNPAIQRHNQKSGTQKNNTHNHVKRIESQAHPLTNMSYISIISMHANMFL